MPQDPQQAAVWVVGTYGEEYARGLRAALEGLLVGDAV
jgi:hypothetical protein